MRLSLRVLCLAAMVILVASANVASADPITVDVAEFRWNVFGDTCDPLVPTSDDCLSQFTLTYLWNGPAPEPVVSGELALDGSFFGSFVDLDSSFPVDQFNVAGVPTTAQASISFLFGSTLVPMSVVLAPSSALFTPEGAFHLFTFEYDDGVQSVPEPSTLALASLGLLAAWRTRRRARTRL